MMGDWGLGGLVELSPHPVRVIASAINAKTATKVRNEFFETEFVISHSLLIYFDIRAAGAGD
jgi:hypothetical protein